MKRIIFCLAVLSHMTCGAMVDDKMIYGVELKKGNGEQQLSYLGTVQFSRNARLLVRQLFKVEVPIAERVEVSAPAALNALNHGATGLAAGLPRAEEAAVRERGADVVQDLQVVENTECRKHVTLHQEEAAFRTILENSLAEQYLEEREQLRSIFVAQLQTFKDESDARTLLLAEEAKYRAVISTSSFYMRSFTADVATAVEERHALLQHSTDRVTSVQTIIGTEIVARQAIVNERNMDFHEGYYLMDYYLLEIAHKLAAQEAYHNMIAPMYARLHQAMMCNEGVCRGELGIQSDASFAQIAQAFKYRALNLREASAREQLFNEFNAIYKVHEFALEEYYARNTIECYEMLACDALAQAQADRDVAIAQIAKRELVESAANDNAKKAAALNVQPDTQKENAGIQNSPSKRKPVLGNAPLNMYHLQRMQDQQDPKYGHLGPLPPDSADANQPPKGFYYIEPGVLALIPPGYYLAKDGTIKSRPPLPGNRAQESGSKSRVPASQNLKPGALFPDGSRVPPLPDPHAQKRPIESSRQRSHSQPQENIGIIGNASRILGMCSEAYHRIVLLRLQLEQSQEMLKQFDGNPKKPSPETKQSAANPTTKDGRQSSGAKGAESKGGQYTDEYLADDRQGGNSPKRAKKPDASKSNITRTRSSERKRRARSAGITSNL